MHLAEVREERRPDVGPERALACETVMQVAQVQPAKPVGGGHLLILDEPKKSGEALSGSLGHPELTGPVAYGWITSRRRAISTPPWTALMSL